MSHYVDLFLSSLGVEERKNAPKNLFVEGNEELLCYGPKISVVGSRKVSEHGKERARIISSELVKRGITVVSGLAMGVDTIAHTTAVKNDGKTIAVLGTSLSKCSPVSNRELLDHIKKEHLAVSQFEEGSRVYPSNFLLRNKTMALISDGTIIIEASEKSGTQHQAWEALRLGRALFLLENVASDPELSWPQQMIEYGAVVLTRENFELIFDRISEGHTTSP